MCISPLNIKHPSYDKAVIRLEVPCGKCVECLQARREDWSLRLAEEAKDHLHTSFITLTYSDDNLTYGEYHPTLVKKDLQDWFKRLRRRIQPEKIRYYAVGEYGTNTLRPHYHVILFGLNNKYIQNGILEQTWKLGQIHSGSLNRSSIHYATKYHLNRNFAPIGCEPSFSLMSRKPGIGSSYLTKMEQHHEGNLERCYYQDGKFKKRLPRFYRDKLYSPEDRENINVMNNRSIYDDEKIEEHYKNNDINYFDYQVQLKEEKIRKFLSKKTEGNTF